MPTVTLTASDLGFSLPATYQHNDGSFPSGDTMTMQGDVINIANLFDALSTKLGIDFSAVNYISACTASIAVNGTTEALNSGNYIAVALGSDSATEYDADEDYAIALSASLEADPGDVGYYGNPVDGYFANELAFTIECGPNWVIESDPGNTVEFTTLSVDVTYAALPGIEPDFWTGFVGSTEVSA